MNPNGMKRDWKRIDPEPEKSCSCEWLEWEKVVWLCTVMACVPLLAITLGNLTS